MPGELASLHELRGGLGAAGFLAAVVAAVALTVLLVGLLRSRGGRAGWNAARVLVVVLVAGSLAGIADLTLFGREGLGAQQRLALDPLVGARGWAGIAWRPVIDNVTLFVPLGASLALLLCRRSWSVPLVLALLVSVAVETFQWAMPTGRIANSADVIANTVGAAVGVSIARLLGGCRMPRRIVAARRR